MGVYWSVENDNPIINCPFYSLHECPVRHPLLSGKNLYSFISRIGNYKHCSVCRTSLPWRYENSVEKVLDDNEAEETAQWHTFSEQRHGRVCKNQAFYNRSEKKWHLGYDPMQCAQYGCHYCTILGKPISPKRANVYYDLKKMWTVAGSGFIPEETAVSVTKGIKLLRASETICEAVVKVCAADIQRSVALKYHSFCYFGGSVTVENLRVDRRPTRDILKDLQDTAAGISVAHQSDIDKSQKEAKHATRIISQEKRKENFRKLIRSNGFENLPAACQRRAEKHLSQDEIHQANTHYFQSLLPPSADPQLSLFEEGDCL